MYKIVLFLLILMNNMACNNQIFKKEEDRVETALSEKQDFVLSKLTELSIPKESIHVLFVAFKDHDRLDVYAKHKMDLSYKLLHQYPICKRSGTLGPKKAEGDKQVPEGLYNINRFNPKSMYHLSLGINYPNELDQSLGYTGSDIFIHGKCETIGCLPMTDNFMKEIYLYALWATEAGQEQIPVYIFPFEMTANNIQARQNSVDTTTLSFWENLQEGYTLFQKDLNALNYKVLDGKYVFSKNY